jgi:hypothetical protein
MWTLISAFIRNKFGMCSFEENLDFKDEENLYTRYLNSLLICTGHLSCC